MHLPFARVSWALLLLLVPFGCRTDASSAGEAPGEARAAHPTDAERVEIGGVSWYVDYEAAVAIARAEGKPLWVHFGENPGCAGCRFFAHGPLRDARVVAASHAFVPLFVDTLDRDQPYGRFGESYGSYPVLRVFDHEGADLAGRLDGNAVAGRIPVEDVLAQLARGREAWE